VDKKNKNLLSSGIVISKIARDQPRRVQKKYCGTFE
jgi:hypothetical protein